MKREDLKVIILLACWSLFTFTLLAQNSDQWEGAMKNFESLDNANSYPADALFFTGSSSIRLWKTLEQDMDPYPVIQRGFGGSKMPDLLRYADRYIKKHEFAAMIVFVANDISGAEDGSDRSPDEVVGLFEEFVLKVKGYHAEVPIFLMAITPTNSRWHVWDQTRAVNKGLAKLADTYDGVLFVPTEDLFLGADGRPMSRLFVADQLHLAPEGYALWTERLRSYLDPVVKHLVGKQ
jgi:lysophospholipase L1-like esterase